MTLMKTIKRIRKVLKFGTFLGTLGFIIATLIQIYARFFMEKAPSWTEEAARLFFVFSIGCASGLAMRGNYYVHFDYVYNKFSPQWKKIIKIIINGLLVVLFSILSYYSIEFVLLGKDENSPSLKFPMSIAFLGIALMVFSITFFTVVQFIKQLKKR